MCEFNTLLLFVNTLLAIIWFATIMMFTEDDKKDN